VTPTEVHVLLGTIALWAKTQADLKALGLAGSWARGTARSDSDLDLLILADDPEKYRSDQRWLYHITLPKPFRIVSYWGTSYGAVWSCHTLLKPAATLELTFAAIEWSSTNPIDEGTRRVVNDGFHVIIDKDRRLQRIVEAIAISN
jgi:uncharacterized protein